MDGTLENQIHTRGVFCVSFKKGDTKTGFGVPFLCTCTKPEHFRFLLSPNFFGNSQQHFHKLMNIL